MANISEGQSNSSSRWNLLDAFIIGAASILIILIGMFITSLIPGFTQWQFEPSGKTPYNYVVALAALEGIGLLLGIYGYGFLRRKMTWKDLGIFKSTRQWLLKAAVVALLMIPVIGIIAAIIQMILGLPISNPQLEFLVPTDFSFLSASAMLIVAGFFVPLAEELFFRGVLYQAIRNHFGVWVGIIISSVIFGALHGDVSIAGATFVMGLVLAFFFEKSRSIWPSVLIHALNNSLKLAAIYVMVLMDINIPGI
ncbi:MAG TPA: type II CAAX endopeptidase family protein [Anaerolineales bacterium]|nr:type II CAAX endopeptidase family protein [Anaerolineales bacterium]